jgi:hypothetical protein
LFNDYVRLGGGLGVNQLKISSNNLAFDVNTSTRMVLTSAGRLGIGVSNPTSHTLEVSGSIYASGDIYAFSDERVKSNVFTLDGNKVFDMRGVGFTKDGAPGSGVIAQELEKVAPELVTDNGEYKAVAYANLTGYLIEAVKTLKGEIEKLKKEIQELQNASSN